MNTDRQYRICIIKKSNPSLHILCLFIGSRPVIESLILFSGHQNCESVFLQYFFQSKRNFKIDPFFLQPAHTDHSRIIASMRRRNYVQKKTGTKRTNPLCSCFYLPAARSNSFSISAPGFFVHKETAMITIQEMTNAGNSS